MTTDAPAKTPAFAIVLGGAAFGLGASSFLIAGIEGRSAGWELLAIPTGLALLAALGGGIGGVVGLTRKAMGSGLTAIGLSGFGALLGLVGFVLGA